MGILTIAVTKGDDFCSNLDFCESVFNIFQKRGASYSNRKTKSQRQPPSPLKYILSFPIELQYNIIHRWEIGAHDDLFR